MLALLLLFLLLCFSLFFLCSFCILILCLGRCFELRLLLSTTFSDPGRRWSGEVGCNKQRHSLYKVEFSFHPCLEAHLFLLPTMRLSSDWHFGSFFSCVVSDISRMQVMGAWFFLSIRGTPSSLVVPWELTVWCFSQRISSERFRGFCSCFISNSILFGCCRLERFRWLFRCSSFS